MYNLYDPVTLANLCRTYGLRPSKHYGQNYLLDSEVIEAIIDTAELSSAVTVVEVGPGFGVLTEALAARTRRLVAFEIEKKLELYWQKRQREFPSLEIVWGNILRQSQIVEQLAPYQVVANIPYQITSPLLRFFLEHPVPPRSLTLLVQKEVAERICAEPGDLSVLGLAVRYRAEPTYIATVPRTVFWPIPAVDSAIIRIVPKPPEILLPKSEEEALFRLIKLGFSNRRKLLFKNIGSFFGKEHKVALAARFQELGLVPTTTRAQELPLETWQKLLAVCKQ